MQSAPDFPRLGIQSRESHSRRAAGGREKASGDGAEPHRPGRHIRRRAPDSGAGAVSCRFQFLVPARGRQKSETRFRWMTSSRTPLNARGSSNKALSCGLMRYIPGSVPEEPLANLGGDCLLPSPQCPLGVSAFAMPRVWFWRPPVMIAGSGIPPAPATCALTEAPFDLLRIQHLTHRLNGLVQTFG